MGSPTKKASSTVTKKDEAKKKNSTTTTTTTAKEEAPAAKHKVRFRWEEDGDELIAGSRYENGMTYFPMSHFEAMDAAKEKAVETEDDARPPEPKEEAPAQTPKEEEAPSQTDDEAISAAVAESMASIIDAEADPEMAEVHGLLRDAFEALIKEAASRDALEAPYGRNPYPDPYADYLKWAEEEVDDDDDQSFNFNPEFHYDYGFNPLRFIANYLQEHDPSAKNDDVPGPAPAPSAEEEEEAATVVPEAPAPDDIRHHQGDDDIVHQQQLPPTTTTNNTS